VKLLKNSRQQKGQGLWQQRKKITPVVFKQIYSWYKSRAIYSSAKF